MQHEATVADPGLVATSDEVKKRVDEKASNNIETSAKMENTTEKGISEKSSTDKNSIEKNSIEHTSKVDKNTSQSLNMAAKPQLISHSASTKHPQLAPFPFMNLSPEVRCEIYEFAIASTINNVGLAKPTEHCTRHHAFPAFLHATQAIRKESREIYFKLANAHLVGFKAQYDENIAARDAAFQQLSLTTSDADDALDALIEFIGELGERVAHCRSTHDAIDANLSEWSALEQACDVLARGLGEGFLEGLKLKKGARAAIDDAATWEWDDSAMQF